MSCIYPSPIHRILTRCRPDSGCLVYEGGRIDSGYGKISIDDKKVFVHRYVFEHEHGEIPENMFICHTCDNPPCVNINHLFLGTGMENSLDMVLKGRSLTGESNPMSKVSDDEAEQIMVLCGAGIRQKDIARVFGICQQSVSNIKTKRPVRLGRRQDS